MPAGRRAPVVDTRTLGRSTLERQLLLRREELTVSAVVERLLGLNAQDPEPPYLALWNRIEGFAIPDLTQALVDGTIVRSTMVRATQHMVTAADFRLLRPLLAPLLRRVQRGGFGACTAGIDLDALVTEARALLADGVVLTRPELGRALAASRPGSDAPAHGATVQYLLPLVHPAPSGTWGVRGPTPYALPTGPAALPPDHDPSHRGRGGRAALPRRVRAGVHGGRACVVRHRWPARGVRAYAS